MEENENKRSERVENGDGVEKWVDKKYLIFFFRVFGWGSEQWIDWKIFYLKKKMKTMPKKKKKIKAKHKGNDKFNASQKKKKKKKKKEKKKQH